MSDQPDGAQHVHAALGGDVRAAVLAALDKLEPTLTRLLQPDQPRAASSCGNCPICAVQAMLRGERPELGAKLAEQAAGLLTLLRVALAEDEKVGAAATERPAGPERRVQRIPVERRP